ncbi:MAG: hypothetical protein NZ959_01195 [Armatimonadetes bacterium]|nr:hypothetical protein [Armatimonadota bacterium]MDW8121871.1 hypothetical protein [Armatimonadota bacterium]
MRWLFLIASCLTSCLIVNRLPSQELSNGLIRLWLMGPSGDSTGFVLSSPKTDEPLAIITLSSGRTLRAQKTTLQQAKDQSFIRFESFRSHPSFRLSPQSFIEVRLLKGEPYPKVSFRLELLSFDETAYRSALGNVPFHFLAATVKGAEVFHQRGWMIGTPVIDPYILIQAGPVSFIKSQWADGWSYAPPFGAYPLPVVGLWKPSQKIYVGYEFVTARLHDRSEKDLSSAYCWSLDKTGEGQFFCLVYPYATEGFRKLRYPVGRERLESHFHIVWSDDLPSTKDPNRLIHKWMWDRYADHLPSSPPMNEFGWLPRNLALKTFPVPSLGDLFVTTGPDNPFQNPGNLAAIGVGYDIPVIDYLFLQKKSESLRRLRQQLDFLAEKATIFTVGKDECVFWSKPISGDWRSHYGPGVPTLRNVQGFMVGQAFLDAVRNGWREQKYLRIVDGVRRWADHFLYTRNCYDDVPDAQFAWSAAPICHFLLSYYYTFRDDPKPERKRLALTAKDLAVSVAYRYLALFPCDNDPDDDIDAAFFMEPNAGYPWLGSACANEIWAFAHALLEVYVVSGDAILGHYLRGMNEKWTWLMRDEWHPRVSDYVHSFAEMYGLYDGVIVGRGKRSTFGGLWGGLEQLAYPVSDADVRVVCGEGGALAFNKDGFRYDIHRYGWSQGKSLGLTFQVIPLQEAVPSHPDVMVTVPHHRLTGISVHVLGKGTKIRPKVDFFPQRPDTILIREVPLGQQVVIGEAPAKGWMFLKNEVVKPRRVRP